MQLVRENNHLQLQPIGRIMHVVECSRKQLTAIAASAQNDKMQPENEVNGNDIGKNEHQ